MLFEIVSGNPLDRIKGPITLVEIELAAVKTLSDSTRILGRLGTIAERMPTTSSALSDGLRATEVLLPSILDLSDCDVEEDTSINVVGLVVKRAVRSRRKRSCKIVQYEFSSPK